MADRPNPPQTPGSTPGEEKEAARASDIEREQLRAENSRDAEEVPDPEPSTEVVGSSGFIPRLEIVEGLAHQGELGSAGAEADRHVAEREG